ncbi:MAG: T9SS type A sorting domain-containing protein [Flavobacteriales bacterium]|nr:T9SS type A sorting domain-containing protein [Flavobacteriales bacterium]
MKFKNYLGLLLAIGFVCFINAQERHYATDFGFFSEAVLIPSIAEQLRTGTFFGPLESGREQRRVGDGAEINPKLKHVANVIPGKGLPIDGDALVIRDEDKLIYPSKDPILVFEANTSNFTPSDPTGAAGPNHYIGGWNIGFRIFAKDGTPLTPAASLGTIFSGPVIGDPIILYDAEVDRFVITEFSNNPNGFKVAISQGPDPVNDGWFVYQGQFNTGAFPDYTKFSIWHDGYYVTANIGSSNRLFVVEREKMIAGEAAQFVALPLPGIVTSGFYSPQVFSATGAHLPTTEATIVYQQDDQWGGVATDHLKLWTATVNWETPGSSSVSTAVQLPVTPFVGVFDGGNFANLPQPGGGPLIDAMQATVMNQAQLRKFPTHNSAVLNFVVNVGTTSQKQAAIRWYELRQDPSGGPWAIHQEGTYTSPGQKSAFNGSMAMDDQGNIGMSYSSIGTLGVQERIAIKYTGRFANDPIGQMTVAETQIGLSTANNPNTRYADYSHLTVDPSDDKTFWVNNEYFATQRKNLIGVFKIAADAMNDVGVISIDSPINGPLTNAEDITITIRNFGTQAQSNFPVFYNVDGGANVQETFTGTIQPLENVQYTFTTTADLSIEGVPYALTVSTDLTNDEGPGNDQKKKTVVNEALGINTVPLNNAELLVLNTGNNQFDITLTTTQNIQDKVLIQVYDILGQIIAFNVLDNNNNKYNYNLDMSYAASGVYIVRVGTLNNGLIKRIVVK